MAENKIIQRITQTVGLVVTVNVLWLLIYYIARGAVHLLDLFRGLEGSLIQGFAIELVAPGFAMYGSLKFSKVVFVNSWVKAGVVLSVLFFFSLYFFYGDFIKPTYESMKTFDSLFKFGFIISILFGSAASYYDIGRNV